MFSLVYVSSAVTPFQAQELASLLETSRRNNAAIGVSGMLLYKDGNFMQALEGEKRVVNELLARIARDPRHHGLAVLLQQDRPDREFGAWSMAYRDLNLSESETPGYSEFLNVPLTDRRFVDVPSNAMKLLLTFKRSM